jgi:hypothetical protein
VVWVFQTFRFNRRPLDGDEEKAMTTDKQTTTAKPPSNSPVPDPQAGASKKQDRELTEAEHTRVQGGFCDASVRF